jgi:tRNA-dihydrouridine synthase 3
MGARVTFSEMAHSGLLAKGERRELVLLRRHASEPCFGVQFAARDPEVAVAAARVAVEQGASLVDINFGCPIDSIVRRGLGAALMEKPRRIERLLQALRPALDVPLFVKIRTGYREGKENAVEVARIAEACGVDALTIHGRTREQRYRRAADWQQIDDVARAVTIPVVGNGDILHGFEARARLAGTGCTAAMAARGALIKPWIFEDFAAGTDCSRSSDERLAVYRRWVAHAVDHWGGDDHGFARIRPFLEFHVDWWRRYVPEDAEIAGERTMQARATFVPRDELESVLQAPDDDALHRACNVILEAFDAPEVALRPSTERRDPSAGGWG